jgi:hypothetical protein
MAYEKKPGQGSAWKNKDKKEDWHAAYRGDVMLPNGDIHYLDITPKKTQAGETYIAVKIGKQKSGGQGAPMSQHSVDKGNGYQPQPSDDSDIPF